MAPAGGCVALACRGDEAHGHHSLVVDDAHIGFIFDVVAAGGGGHGGEDGAIPPALQQGTPHAQELGRPGHRIGEAGGKDDRGDAVPAAILGDEDGADHVLVEFRGHNGVLLVGGAQRREVQLHGAGVRDVAALQVLLRRADGRQRGGAGAVVLGLELARERLRRRNAVVHIGELHGTEA
jgi:hypothetical protein